ncbi:LysM peptidoglycan-binding domain-containing protein [Flavobacterium sp. F372]|uniref:LysM peptidoglycan-binding domain-containing protein n=1 Tax=Flavobacterium bernardetii TaxID=2813823 RepID=A0ABR7IYT3_9FLAO|nr:peptidoglycan endopeptidase [Flavobacterium bernardetii]MBC5834707.1 LysM peptidoglycan-binding domain-containing protein [Flavobacterium bernardetii]NHF70355.1 LysM peptidoglycan-binding domain-containing protein [Flavobacterium bernardetii]
MKFFITAIFSLFISLGFSQENLTHTVRKGESLYSISKKYKVSVSQLEELNPTAKKGLDVNAVLKISEKKDVEVLEHEVVAKETLFGLSKKYNISIEKLKQLNPSIESEGLKIGQVVRLSKSINYSIPEKIVVEQPKQKKDKIEKVEKIDALQEVFHTVLPKETKYGLSKKYKISIAELEQLNPQIKNELAVGTRLVILTSEKIDKEVVVDQVVFPKEINLVSEKGLLNAESVIATASSNIGVKYRSGGTDSAGFDCSGLMFSSFKTIDITLPRSSSEQASVGIKIDKISAQKGDLIFFATGGSSRINHVGLITEVSENDIKFVHSSTSSGVIISSVTEDYYDKHFVQINRVISQ